MNSFDILSKDTTLQPRLFLEASAGTGKTFTIEHLFVRLLLETPLKLEEIVVVTFTRAATRELKDRIRKTLEQIVQQEATHPYLERTSLDQRLKIEGALKSFESAKIFTIHGFCSHLLTQFAIDAGIGFGQSEWSREEEMWAAKEFLREQTALSSGQLRRLLGSFQYEVDRLEEALIDYGGRKENCPSAKELLEQINKAVQQISFFPIASEFEAIRSSYKGTTSNDFSSQVKQLEEAILQKHLSWDVWNLWISQSAFCLKNLGSEQLKVRAKTSASSALLALREAVLPPLEIAKNSRLIFSKLAAEWLLFRKNLSEKNEKVTPDDLLELVHTSLQKPLFVSKVREKYHAAIIDEFQDTDPLQWDIFKTLFLDDPQKAAYLVGDPKQSIYAFRKADIYTFLEAAKVFDSGQKFSLVRNFRSSSQLIGELNALLCTSPWMEIPKQEAYLTVPKALSFHEGDGKLCLMIAEGEKGRSSKWPSLEIEETQLFPFIAEELQKGAPDAAILVKDRYQAARIKLFLESWGIPTTMHKTAPLANSPVIEFLEEIADGSVRKILLGPFAALPLHELSQEVEFQAKQNMQRLEPLWEKGFATFFSAFLRTSFGKETAYDTFCKSQNRDDLMELTQKAAAVTSPYALKLLLQEIKEKETEDRQAISSEKGVKIMTIHASKGLEFETVFALGLASRSPEQELSDEEIRELDAEKMRQFYVAATRAKKQLYIPIVKEMPEPSYDLGEGSAVELFLSKARPDLSSFSQQFLKDRVFNLVRTKKEEAAAPKMPTSKETGFLRRIQSFSSLAQEVHTVTKGDDQGITAGAQTGVTIHRILERYFNQEGALRSLIEQEVSGTTLAPKVEELLAMIEKALDCPLGDLSLNAISFDALQTEMEFFYETPQGWMKGYIDLCLEHAGKLYVVDWKTNLLESAEAESILRVMQAHDYLLQGQIYREAVQKYLKRFPHLSFGGVYFVFVRGPAVYWYEG